MSLLTIVQNATDEIGLSRPSSVIANTDQTARTLLGLANREGKILSRHRGAPGGWAVLQREHTFTTVAGTAEYALPDDFERLLNDTAWDRDAFWEMRGPLSPQEWQAVKSGLFASPALRKRWRIKRSASSGSKKFFVDPTPDSADDLVFEYVSKNWLSNSAGDTFYDSWQADTDVALLDEDLIEMGVIWRFKKSKGFEYLTDLADYESQRDQRIAGDGGAPTLYLARQRFFLPPGNTPETGFGS